MAKWVNTLVLDGGLNYIKTNATEMLLIKAYTSGDTYATVVGNKVAAVTTSSSNFSLYSTTTFGITSRSLVTSGSLSAVATASSGATPNLHIAFTDGSSTVYWVTDESSDQVINSGNTVYFPAVTYTSNQPL
jgi:hypothetical protein